MSFLRTSQGLLALLLVSLAAACAPPAPTVHISKKPAVQQPTPSPQNIQATQATQANEPSSERLGHGSCQSADLQAEILLKINKLRSAGGYCGSQRFAPAAPLRWNTRLQQAADMHAQDMAQHDFFNHKSATNGTTLPERLRNVGYRYQAAGENIGAGSTTVAQVVDMWQASPGHCVTMMTANFVELGASCKNNSNSRYKNYWTLKAALPG